MQGTKGQNEVKGVQKKVNQIEKDKETRAQTQATTQSKGAVAMAETNLVTCCYP